MKPHRKITCLPTLPVCAGLVLLAGTLLTPPQAAGLQIRDHDPVRHNRFASGYPGNPAPNTSFHADYYDFSGVGWRIDNARLSYTLISPKHFVGALHAGTPPGTVLQFLGRDGALRSYTVAAYHTITNTAGANTDLFVGELDPPVRTCDPITFYPILDLPAESNYQGLSLLGYGWRTNNASVGIGTLQSFQDFNELGFNSTRTFKFRYQKLFGGGSDDYHFEIGDSGSPSFVARDGGLFVVGVHLATLANTAYIDNFDTFVPHYLDQISSLLEADGYAPATSAAEAFRLCYTVTPVGPDAYEVSWVGHRGRVYQLFSTTNFLDYMPVSGPVTADADSVASVVDSGSTEPVKFYRARRVE